MHAYLVTNPVTPLASPASPRSELIQDMLDAVERAEINTRKFWRNPKLKALTKENEALKGKKDYVTKEVDERNQQIIFGHLVTRYPQTEKFGEELGQDRSNEVPLPGDTRWVLDPIDSTRNFICGTSDYSISLAHQAFHDGHWHTDAGVVAAPGHNKVFWAEKGKSAHVIRVEGSSQGLRTLLEEEIHVRALLSGGIVGSQLENALLERMVEILLVKESEPLELFVIQKIHGADRRAIKMIDSGALALAMIGTERDGMITGGLTEYDKTAGLLIAKEAGAVMSEIRLKGHEGTSGGTVHIVASDPQMLQALEDVVKSAVKRNEEHANA
jgi:fructose-1,6-bisphosphatase/inositol monophosphatase family enzyme